MEYDGTRYSGFQIQAERLTIQGEMERALAQFTGEAVRIRGASRTDSGAHAVGQVVDFLVYSNHPVDYLPRALNFYLEEDIRVQAAFEMAAEFHSRKDAISRTYRYCIFNRCWPSPLRRHACHWVKQALDVDRMATAAESLLGSHDFKTLGLVYPKERSTMRTVTRWEVWREHDTVLIECEANGFLRHQIRRVNAMLIEIGKGTWPEDMIVQIMRGKLEGLSPWPSVPAKGLCLMKVTYPHPMDSGFRQNHRWPLRGPREEMEIGLLTTGHSPPNLPPSRGKGFPWNDEI